MKAITIMALALCLPYLLMAQQKPSSPGQMQGQLDELRTEMQSRIHALQDSVVRLQKMLNEQQLNRMMKEFSQSDVRQQYQDLAQAFADQWLKGNTISDFDFRYSIPSDEDFRFRSLPEKQEIEKKLSEMDGACDAEQPRPGHEGKHLHRQRLLEMLPFGKLLDK